MNPTPSPGARITLLFEKFSDFVEGYASNLSMGGMFLATTEHRPVGSVVEFEIKLTDGFRLVEGLGEVVWSLPGGRGSPEDGSRPAGLAVRFQSLDDRGRELLLKIMEEQVKSGGEPFDLEAMPPDAMEAEEVASAVDAETPPVAGGAPVTLPDAPGGEPKILGEDGFTLLDADASSSGPGAVRSQRAFEELEFDAPWGERLPEIPREVLEEGLDSEVTLPEPAPPAGEPPAQADGDLFELDEEEAAASAELDPVPAPTAGVPLAGGLEDSFLLAEEAVAELDLTPPPVETGEPDFEDIDFSVPPAGGNEAAPLPDFLDDEDPTLVTTSERPAAPSLDEPQAVELELEGSALPAPPAPVEADPFELVPEGDVVPAPPAPVEGDLFELVAEGDAVPAPPAPVEADPFELAAEGPAAPAAPSPAEPEAVQGVEDDLFTDATGAGTGHVLRQALTGSVRSVGVAALVLALAGFGYVYRDAVGQLLGFASPPPGPPLASAIPVEPPAPRDAQPLPAESRQAEKAAPAEASPEAGKGLSPPVIDVGVGEGTEALGTGPETGSEEPDPVTRLASVPAPAPPASSSTSARPATRVDRITWLRGEEGTLVTVQLDGDLAEGRYVHSALTWAPDREMVEIKGIEEPYVRGRIEIGSAEVRQLRIGHHLKPGGDVLRLVFDFPGAGPRVTRVRGLGDRLEILVQR